MKTIFKSLLAGMAIGIGGWIYLLCPNKIVGAMLFSFGLYTVVTRQYNLYTGLIGFVDKWEQWREMTTILSTNLVGAFIMGSVARLSYGGITDTLVANKLSMPLYIVLIRAIMCGIMMRIAVGGWRGNQSPINILCPVAIFILCGFEHCIADMFYFSCSGLGDWRTIPFLIAAIVGNSLGAIWYDRLERVTR